MSCLSGILHKTFPFLKRKTKHEYETRDNEELAELELGFGNNATNRKLEILAANSANVRENTNNFLANPDKQRVTQKALQILQRVGLPQQSAINTFFSARIVQENEEICKHITEYITNGQEHGYGIKLLNIVRIVRDGDMEFHHMSSCKDEFRMMLWHGTEKSAIASILEDGFRLPPPRKQMFGPGVYFADRISKSCNYCFDSQNGTLKPKPGTKAFLLLCDVLLGNMYNAKKAHHKINQPPENFRQTFHSVMCTGENVPDRCFNKYFNESIIPCGPTIENKRFPSYTVAYNEYIVYNTDKIKIQFLIEVEFLSKPVKIDAKFGYNNNI